METDVITHPLVSGMAPETSRSLEIPSKPVLGLPIARVIPQDVHSVLDYVSGATTLCGAFVAHEPMTRVASVALGAAGLGVAKLTDCRLSVLRLIPIEVHEGIDYAYGIAAIAAPFVLGYWRKDPIAAVLHVAAGVTTIIASLFTDYRAARGVGRQRAHARANAY